MANRSVLIIGSGVVGLSTAWELLRLGAEVTIVSDLEPGHEVGWGSVAWSNASSKVRLKYPDHYVVLNQRGMEAGQDLHRELGEPGWLHQTGAVEVVAGDEAKTQLAADVSRLGDYDYRAELISAEKLAEVLPGVLLEDDEQAVYFPTEAWVDSAAFATALTGAIVGAGGRFVRRAVTGFTRSETGIAGVELSGGTTLHADIVIFAVGARTTELAALAGITTPVLPESNAKVPGLVAAITSPPESIDRLLQVPGVIVRPFGPGRALVAGDGHGQVLSATPTRSELAAAADVLLARATARVPALAGAALLDVRLSWRPIPHDGITIIGPATGADNAYVMATHSGFTLGPLLGRLAAKEIMQGEVDPILAPYRPERFDTELLGLTVDRVDSASA